MKINFFGNIDSSKALHKYVEEKLTREVEKYFDSALSADVHFKKENHKERTIFHATIVINEGSKTGVTIKSDAESDDPHYSFDAALNKISKQLRRYKNKLKDYARYNRDKEILSAIQAQQYTLPSSFEYEKEESQNKKLDIIKEKEMRIEKLTVAEAIMKMDLANLPALMFENKDNNRLNLVYYRKDGNISWIDPKSQL